MSQVVPIFVLSLPRSGSTLLQRVLSGHSNIRTVTEPWILLPFVYSIKPDSFARYGHKTLQIALEGVMSNVEGGREFYLSQIRHFVLQIYGNLDKGGGRYFLDKTPRYHLIADELLEIFPEGKFIFLWRDPLAVVASFVEYFAKGKWLPELYCDDLYGGITNLCSAYSKSCERVLSINYENLVRDPGFELKKIGSYLGLSIDVDLTNVVAGNLGDERAQSSKKIDGESIEKWRDTIDNMVRRRWCKRYIEWIGADRLSVMGYDYQSLIDKLDSVPNSIRGGARDCVSNCYASLRTKVREEVLKHG